MEEDKKTQTGGMLNFQQKIEELLKNFRGHISYSLQLEELIEEIFLDLKKVVGEIIAENRRLREKEENLNRREEELTRREGAGRDIDTETADALKFFTEEKGATGDAPDDLKTLAYNPLLSEEEVKLYFLCYSQLLRAKEKINSGAFSSALLVGVIDELKKEQPTGQSARPGTASTHVKIKIWQRLKDDWENGRLKWDKPMNEEGFRKWVYNQ